MLATILLALGLLTKSKFSFIPKQTIQQYEKLISHAEKVADTEPESHSGVEVEMVSAMADDLDTPGVVATLWNALKSDGTSNAQKKSILLLADRLLGLKLFAQKKITIPESVLILAEKRKIARSEKNYAESDRLRKEIEGHGFTVKDEKNEQILKKS